MGSSEKSAGKLCHKQVTRCVIFGRFPAWKVRNPYALLAVGFALVPGVETLHGSVSFTGWPPRAKALRTVLGRTLKVSAMSVTCIPFAFMTIIVKSPPS